MTPEYKGAPNIPPIVNPREFLEKPFERLRVGRLETPPDLELLRWLPSLKDETGLVLQEPTWYIIKASRIGVPSWIMPKDSDVLMHSHPIVEVEELSGPIPSTGDFLNCSPIARQLIVSSKGITQYWPVEEEYKRILEANFFSFGPGTLDKYLMFLESINARFEVFPWEEIKENKLTELLSANASTRSHTKLTQVEK